MIFARRAPILALAVALALAVGACAQAPSPTAAPAGASKPAAATAVPAPTTAPTVPPATPTLVPTATPLPAATPTPVAVATKPAASPTASGPSLADVMAKAKGTTEFSFSYKMTVSGQTLNAKAYVKSTKMRQEMTIAGQNAVMLMDFSKQVAYVLMPEQKMAMKIDFSQAMSQAQSPSETVGSLPANAKLAGVETVDGKLTVVVETTTTGGTAKMWILADRGLPVKMEMNTPSGTVLAEFSDYQFGPQPDSLFELPPGTQVVDAPTGLPGKAPAKP